MDKAFSSYQVEDRSYVAYIKREIHREVMQFKFTERQRGEIDIIVSELSSNLVKHAKSGELLYRVSSTDGAHPVFEIISLDNGPGMTDPGKMMRDGISTTATLGQGLGAMSRLSSLFQLYSMPDWGTVAYSLYSSKDKKYAKNKSLDLQITGLCVSKPSESVSGDAFKVKRTDGTVQLFLGDGLGHGVHAKEAVGKAIEAFESSTETDPVNILREIHEKVRRSRGLVATIAVVDKKNGVWRICGLGNITTRLYTGIAYRNYMPYNGTLGLNIPYSMKESVFDVQKNQNLIMNSDGIKTRWDITRYPGIFKYDGAIVAAAVYKDYTRRTDDSSLVIAKVI